MSDPQTILAIASAIQSEVIEAVGPPEQGLSAGPGLLIPMSSVRGTRGYIESISNQANGCFANGWYDACAVMLRRLLETLIIEAFEKHGSADSIKGAQGDFLYLRELISKTLSENTWNLSRNCKQALPKLKDLGDRSAHSRRYLAPKLEIENLASDIRLVVQELLCIAGLK